MPKSTLASALIAIALSATRNKVTINESAEIRKENELLKQVDANLAELHNVALVENETLRARLAELEAQEPVAWEITVGKWIGGDRYINDTSLSKHHRPGAKPLYAAPVVSPDVAEKYGWLQEQHLKVIAENQSLEQQLTYATSEINELREHSKFWQQEYDGQVEMSRSVKTELEAARKDAEWISVDDRLPERYTEVMVWPHPSEQAMTAQFGLIRKESAPTWHYSEYISGFGWEEQECNPTHWKPLPAPPAIEQAKGGA